MSIDAAGKLVRRGVESHKVSSSPEQVFSQTQHTTAVCRGGGLDQYQGTGADRLQLRLRLCFRRRLSAGVDMICIATACAKKTCQPRLLAQALSKSSDFLIWTQDTS